MIALILSGCSILVVFAQMLYYAIKGGDQAKEYTLRYGVLHLGFLILNSLFIILNILAMLNNLKPH